MRNLSRLLAIGLASACAFIPSGEALAAEFPTKEIALASPYGRGGAAGRAARLVAKPLSESLGVPVNVIYKIGASGVFGSQWVRSSKKDGHTVLLARVGAQVSVPALSPNIPYKWNDFTFLALLERNPFVLVVNANSPYKTFDEFQTALKNGAELSYASAGAGTLLHVATLVMADSMQVDPDRLTHIPFNGGGAARKVLVDGDIDFMWQNLSGVIRAIESGKLRALAVTTDDRVAALKDVPTVKELNHPQMSVVVGWSGIYGPPNLPKDVIDAWVEKLEQLKTNEEWTSATVKAGSIPDVRGPDGMREFAREQFESFERVIKALGQ